MSGTDLPVEAGPDVPPVYREAVRRAEQAAAAANVEVRSVYDREELATLSAILTEIWGADIPPVHESLLRALAKAGNYVSGAYADGNLAGGCVGFFGAPRDRMLHSHIAGVRAEQHRRGIGYALKCHQRGWALEHGVGTVSWTFDPLVARNASFNLAKLGAKARDYLPNFYGSMNDGINGVTDSDRLLITWDLASSLQDPPRPEPMAATPAAAHVLTVGQRGLPERHAPPADAALLGVGVPTDIEALRRDDPETAQQWRTAVRSIMGSLFSEGGAVRGFDVRGWYVVATGDNSASGKEGAQ
ncbi:MAG: GNAT family N-acetyltransferase [Nocardiopsaceae bacterium]|nr:GNAT family N-acetyltransferase [Nocardiopsaceae bacterium]